MVITEGTYLVWIDFSKYESDAKTLEYLMKKEARVALDEGYIFGEEGEGFERINVATSRLILKEALDRIANALLNHIDKK